MINKTISQTHADFREACLDIFRWSDAKYLQALWQAMADLEDEVGRDIAILTAADHFRKLMADGEYE